MQLNRDICNMKLIIMTKSTFFVEEDKILTALFDEGMDNLHLNKPAAAPMYSERLLTLLPDDSYGRITVHEHFYLKDEYGLKGIHIDTPQAAVPQGYKGHVSRSCVDIEDLKATKKNADYVFLKNTFHSNQEGKSTACHTIAELEEAAERGLIDKKVYAMGGVNVDNIKIARELGFGGVVVCGDLWSRFDIHQQLDYKDLITHFDRLRKAVS